MQELVCRDCGLTLSSSARGCPRCALNLEVENKFDRIVIASLAVPLTILVISIGVYLIR
jgi:RNA polymerase subunit RPABC4/transcription elongation factor Spt4